MVNEVFQWALLVIIAFALLGVLCQVALGLPTHHRAQTISGPPLGSPLPRSLLRRLPASVMGGSVRADGLIVAFIAESCVGCQRLLREISSRRGPSEAPLVLVAKNPSAAFLQALQHLRTPIIQDDGRIWRECRVTNTPLVARVDRKGRVVAKGVTHEVDSVGAVTA